MAASSLETAEAVMRRALELARRGEGFVEPNPMVGAVIVSAERELIAEGWHQRFGEAHAEVNAIAAAGERTRGAELFVTLEPCSHFGKTPPCVDAVIAAGFRRVVIGCVDPASHAGGRGIQTLRDTGVVVEVGVCEPEAQRLIAPFTKLTTQRRPWVIAKWAMTLDGRIATRTGHSKWISCEESRSRVHELRGRMDAIITGAGTVRADDPLLTARPPGPRTALRVVVDSTGASVTADSKLMQSLADVPVLVCVAADCNPSSTERLQSLGCEVLRTSETDCVNVAEVLDELGRRNCTNVLLEAGSRLLGAFFDQRLVDEVHVFIAPKIVGGEGAMSPIGGMGAEEVTAGLLLADWNWMTSGVDLWLIGNIAK